MFHGLLVFGLLRYDWVQPSPNSRSIQLTLVSASEQTPEQIPESPSEPNPESRSEPLQEPVPEPPIESPQDQPTVDNRAPELPLESVATEELPQQTPAAQSPPVSAVLATKPSSPPDDIPLAVPSKPAVTAVQLMAQFEKYRLDDALPLLRIEPSTEQPRELGHINQQNLLAMLDSPLPRLPFADPDTPFVFYSTGFKGEIERLIDKITRRSSHTTKWGTKVECVYTLIGVFCGFG